MNLKIVLNHWLRGNKRKETHSMGRLIDADRLKEALHEDCMTAMGTIDESTLNLLMIEIEEMPTTYDVDKVVKRLEFELETNTYYSKVYDMGIKDAIAIVKGAVKG